MTCSVIIVKEDERIVATDFATGIASQGMTIDEAMESLKEALELHYEDNDVEGVSTKPVLFTTMQVNV